MIVSTGKLLKTYMISNGITIAALARESGVSPKTIYLVLSDEGKLNARIASAVEKLIPGLSALFLVKYDAQYQLEKKQFMLENGISNPESTLKTFGIKDIVDETDDQVEMVKIAFAIFGKDNVMKKQFDLSDLSPSFSLAKNEQYESVVKWVRLAYYEYSNSQNNDLLVFDETEFDRLFPILKQLCKTDSFSLSISNMKRFCAASGINFYFKKSLRNSRVKGVVLKNKEGKLFVFVSDLFKRLDLLWLAFIHEMIHIKNGDYNVVNLNREENEINVNKEVFDYFNGEDISRDFNVLLAKNSSKKDAIIYLAGKYDIAVGIVATLLADKYNLYKEAEVTNLFTRIKDSELCSCF